MSTAEIKRALGDWEIDKGTSNDAEITKMPGEGVNQ